MNLSDEPDPAPRAGALPPPERHDLRVLTAIRRIIRAADLFSRKLAGQHGITVPQLLCLNKVVETGGLSIKDLAREIHLSPSTIVGIIDRLEARCLVERHRSKPDKRLVRVEPTPEGRRLAQRSPSPLHANLVAGFAALPASDQRRIADALTQLVSLMEIDRVDAAPILETDARLDR